MSQRPKCPDDGTCHHECENVCFRVKYCEPLTIAGFPNNEWPVDIRHFPFPIRKPDGDVK